MMVRISIIIKKQKTALLCRIMLSMACAKTNTAISGAQQTMEFFLIQLQLINSNVTQHPTARALRLCKISFATERARSGLQGYGLSYNTTERKMNLKKQYRLRSTRIHFR